MKDMRNKAFTEAFLRVEYLPQLAFKTKGIEKTILKRIAKLSEKEEIPSKNDWLLALYEDSMAKGELIDIELRWIGREMGYGVFATKDLPEFTYIGEYTGEIRRRRILNDQKNNYCFRYQIASTLTPYVIDAKRKGNMMRFLNHSDTPNVQPHSLVYKDGLAHIILCTNRSVQQGEELRYDYGPDFWRRRVKKES